jgi:diguanylate cyclase (GGDEF)-like protein/PAS domain S-box-containing protein
MSRTPIRKLLLVEDNLGDARVLREMFNEEGVQITELTHVESLSEAEKHLADHSVDITLLDLGLPDAQGLEAVRRVHAAAPRVPLVVLTGLDDESMALQSLQEGAQDYLIKGQIESRGLLRAIRYAIERKIMEEVLFAEKEQAQVTLSSIGDPVVSTDISGNMTFLNLVAERMTGWSREEAAGRPAPEVFRIFDATSHEIISNPMEIAMEKDKTVYLPSNCLLIRRDGVEIPIGGSMAPIHDPEGHVAGAVIVFRDVTRSLAIELQTTYTAEHDFLTGLPNRMLLNDRISQAIALAPRHGDKVAVLFLDLDGFKYINDSLGHSIGDKLLQSIAKHLVASVRSSDTISRQGGDEFVALLSAVEHWEDIAITASRILRAVAETHVICEHELHVTTSIGISVYPDDGLDAETLIKNADTAMYQAKGKGKNNYHFFKQNMNVRAGEPQFLESSLGRALERQEFLLHYQPKVDLETGAITGAEALIRWMDPDHGLIPPAQFVPVAEACGLIVPIGRWVLREACRQARAWMDGGLRPIPVAVNISAVELRTKNFLEGVCGILKESRLEPRYLELELTESVLMQDDESTISVLQALKAMGVQLTVDDFGTGNSSLGYLRRFPIDTLKIDQSFVHEICTSADDAAFLGAMMSVGKTLKKRVVAEGVEKREQLTFLQAERCSEGQGYYFSPAVDAEHFAQLLGTGKPDFETPVA